MLMQIIQSFYLISLYHCNYLHITNKFSRAIKSSWWILSLPCSIRRITWESASSHPQIFIEPASQPTTIARRWHPVWVLRRNKACPPTHDRDSFPRQQSTIQSIPSIRRNNNNDPQHEPPSNPYTSPHPSLVVYVTIITRLSSSLGPGPPTVKDRIYILPIHFLQPSLNIFSSQRDDPPPCLLAYAPDHYKPSPRWWKD